MSDETLRLRGRPARWPYTPISQWVAVSGISPVAAHAYTLLRHLVYLSGATGVAEIGLDDLAALLGYSRGDKIKKFIDELVAIKAVVRHQNGRGMVNEYTVNEEPQPGYDGIRGVEHWLELRGLAKRSLAAETPAQGDGGADRPTARGEQQVRPETPAQGDGDDSRPPAQGFLQASPETPGQGVQTNRTPERGDGPHPDRGVLEPPVQGVPLYELRVLNQQEVTPPPPGDPVTSREPAALGGGEEDPRPDKLTTIVDEIAAIRPGWEPADIRAALLAAKDRGRDPAHAVRALIALAEDVRGVRYEPTGHPSRLNAYDGRWWADTAERPKPSPRATGPRCRRHGLAKPCQPCADEAAERLGEADPPLARQLAAQLARQRVDDAAAAARAVMRRNAGRQLPAGDERPGLAALRAAVEELAPPAPAAAESADEATLAGANV